MWIAPAWANLQWNSTALLTSYMIVFRFCWPELCLFFPLSLRCCLRSVSNWNTWEQKIPFESISLRNITVGKHKWAMQNPTKQTTKIIVASLVNAPAIEIKTFWHQNDDQVCKLWGMKITYRSCRLPLAISSFQRSTRVIDHNCKPLL